MTAKTAHASLPSQWGQDARPGTKRNIDRFSSTKSTCMQISDIDACWQTPRSIFVSQHLAAPRSTRVMKGRPFGHLSNNSLTAPTGPRMVAVRFSFSLACHRDTVMVVAICYSLAVRTPICRVDASLPAPRPAIAHWTGTVRLLEQTRSRISFRVFPLILLGSLQKESADFLPGLESQACRPSLRYPQPHLFNSPWLSLARPWLSYAAGVPATSKRSL